MADERPGIEPEFFDVFHDLLRWGGCEVRRGYGGWVPEVYDLMEGDFEDDIPLVLELAEETGGPVLDLGCGTGRLTIPLLREGLEVFALDSDARMLEILEQKTASLPPGDRQRLTLLQQDMRDCRTPRPAALAVCSTNTFLYLGSLDDQREALRSIYHCLMPGGVLWLDVFVPKPNPSADEPYLTSHLNPETGTLLLYGAQTREDHFTERSLVNAFTMLLRREGSPQVFLQSWTYAWLHPNELRLLLEGAGFRLRTLLGDYDGGEADEASVQMIAIAERRS